MLQPLPKVLIVPNVETEPILRILPYRSSWEIQCTERTNFSIECKKNPQNEFRCWHHCGYIVFIYRVDNLENNTKSKSRTKFDIKVKNRTGFEDLNIRITVGYRVYGKYQIRCREQKQNWNYEFWYWNNNIIRWNSVGIRMERVQE